MIGAVTRNAFFEEVVERTIGGERLSKCIQCGTCAGACPYGDVMHYTPRRLIGMLREGFIEEVVASDDLLTCVTCYDCWDKCPRGLHLTDVLLPVVKEQVLLSLPEVMSWYMEKMFPIGRTVAKVVRPVITKVTSLRGRLGAFQKTTLDANIGTLNDTLENLTAAESAIRDADFAQETANLTKAQILQQAGTAVLAQANSAPQGVLRLIG